MQRYRRVRCPLLAECQHKVTREYFLRICMGGGYKSCNHYAERMGELRIPIQWLQKVAVEQEKARRLREV